MCSRNKKLAWLLVVALSVPGWTRLFSQSSFPTAGYELNDSHFHLTNYIQEGTDIHDFLNIMGTKVGRVARFGIPLQQ